MNKKYTNKELEIILKYLEQWKFEQYYFDFKKTKKRENTINIIKDEINKVSFWLKATE